MFENLENFFLAYFPYHPSNIIDSLRDHTSECLISIALTLFLTALAHFSNTEANQLQSWSGVLLFAFKVLLATLLTIILVWGVSAEMLISYHPVNAAIRFLNLGEFYILLLPEYSPTINSLYTYSLIPNFLYVFTLWLVSTLSSFTIQNGVSFETLSERLLSILSKFYLWFLPLSFLARIGFGAKGYNTFVEFNKRRSSLPANVIPLNMWRLGFLYVTVFSCLSFDLGGLADTCQSLFDSMESSLSDIDADIDEVSTSELDLDKNYTVNLFLKLSASVLLTALLRLQSSPEEGVRCSDLRTFVFYVSLSFFFPCAHYGWILL